MPWKKDKVPDQVKALSNRAKSIWVGAANAWIADHPADDVGAIQVGWGAVKLQYQKKGNKWLRRKK